MYNYKNNVLEGMLKLVINRSYRAVEDVHEYLSD
jgi:hypothetical protein